MCELLLLRHAKSDWGDPSLADHDRPLSRRGRRAAPAMGRWMVANDVVPDRVLCSTALRTRETWAAVEEVLAAAGVEPEVLVLEELYLASPRTMIDLMREHGEGASRLMLVGHNPGTHDLAIALAASGDERLLDRLDRKFPTGALARIHLDVDGWPAARTGIGRLLDFIRPKDLDRADELRL